MTKCVIRVWIPSVMEGTVLNEHLNVQLFDSKALACEALRDVAGVYRHYSNLWILSEDGVAHIPAEIIQKNVTVFSVHDYEGKEQ